MTYQNMRRDTPNRKPGFCGTNHFWSSNNYVSTMPTKWHALSETSMNILVAVPWCLTRDWMTSIFICFGNAGSGTDLAHVSKNQI
jgi:hypothetical protein